MRDLLNEKKGIILDIEGVLVSNIETGEIYADALKFMKKINQDNYNFVLLTNLARISSIRVSEMLANLGFDMIDEEKVINPTKAAVGQILDKKFEKPVKVFLISEGGHLEDLALYPWIKINKSKPIDALLLGASRNITYSELNFAFRLFKQGKPLIVLGGDLVSYGKYLGDSGEYLMEGAFGKMLEIAADREAIYVGKPCKEMFLEALEKISLTKDEVFMVGDTFNRDILGAVRLGMDSVWVVREYEKIEKYYEIIEENAKEKIRVFITDRLGYNSELKQIY